MIISQCDSIFVERVYLSLSCVENVRFEHVDIENLKEVFGWNC